MIIPKSPDREVVINNINVSKLVEKTLYVRVHRIIIDKKIKDKIDKKSFIIHN